MMNNTSTKQHILPEWRHQLAVIITWPHQFSAWQPILNAVEACYLDLASAAAASQKLLIITYNQQHQKSIQKKLHNKKANIHNISFANIETNDTWVRDYGPITVLKNNQLIWQDFEFNAWGDKFESRLDNLVNQKLIQHEWFCENYSLEKQNFVLEGGSIEANAQGDLLTTASCVDNLNRHNTVSEQECIFHQALGCHNIHKLRYGALAGDDTDGHIDTLARFASNNLILYVKCSNSSDEHYRALSLMEKEIQALPFEAVSLPMPDARYDKNKHRLPATYANFLIMNDVVLVPTYHCKQDEAALSIFKACFKNKEIIGVNCNALIYEHGSLHCSTMQVPAISSSYL